MSSNSSRFKAEPIACSNDAIVSEYTRRHVDHSPERGFGNEHERRCDIVDVQVIAHLFARRTREAVPFQQGQYRCGDQPTRIFERSIQIEEARPRERHTRVPRQPRRTAVCGKFGRRAQSCRRRGIVLAEPAFGGVETPVQLPVAVMCRHPASARSRTSASVLSRHAMFTGDVRYLPGSGVPRQVDAGFRRKRLDSGCQCTDPVAERPRNRPDRCLPPKLARTLVRARHSAPTSWPRATSVVTTARPMKPPAPVTRTRLIRRPVRHVPGVRSRGSRGRGRP